MQIFYFNNLIFSDYLKHIFLINVIIWYSDLIFLDDAQKYVQRYFEKLKFSNGSDE